MNKYYLMAVGIALLLICTSFVSSSRNILENEPVNIKNGMLYCDHTGYVLGSGSNCWLYEFILNNPSNLTCICEGSGGFTSSGAWSNDGFIYICEYGTGILLKLNPETCEWESIGGGGTSLYGLAFNPFSEKLYGSSDNNYLFRIDPNTGEQELIGAFGSDVQLMIGMAFDSEGTLYGWDLGNDKLWTIDTITGDAAEVGALGINLNYVCDGDFCKDDDILYISAPGSPPDYIYQLYECDKETGDCGHVGQFPEDVDVSALLIPFDYNPENNPPYVPSNPRPLNGTTGVAGGRWFTWSGGDPDGDNVTYDLYFGNSTPPPKVMSNMSNNGTGYDPPGEWLVNITYYWKVVAWDEHGASTEGPIWRFRLAPNYPPFPARDPIPPDGAKNVPVNASLYWTGSDPNGWDVLRYDVYFGPNLDPPLVEINQSENYYDPYGEGDMPLFQDFYWRIDTRDKEGEVTTGPNWTFATGVNCTPPPPAIDGPTHGRIKIKYNYTFYTTEEGGVIFIVDWGDESTIERIYPTSPDGQRAIANHSWDKKGTYIIRARTEDEYGMVSDWGELEVTMPRIKTTTYSLLQWFFERFQLLEVFLRIMNL